MAWLLIISSMIVIWIAFLFKILHGAYSPSKGAFVNDSHNGGSAKKRNVLLVVYHPNDESMFFAPTINYLTLRGHYVHILCLSIVPHAGFGLSFERLVKFATGIENIRDVIPFPQTPSSSEF
ncbi:putative asparagine--tRNA ligase [Rosa chinensis]|uniref:Putative asparagine--tRNA ligase n=1 Tax=Rosa chinensis TaxID=74649 RepID=A0A2P6P8N3_ROSCH|nr:putative asparagine--tRNA ligase [Rosa chinensis]